MIYPIFISFIQEKKQVFSNVSNKPYTCLMIFQHFVNASVAAGWLFWNIEPHLIFGSGVPIHKIKRVKNRLSILGWMPLLNFLFKFDCHAVMDMYLVLRKMAQHSERFSITMSEHERFGYGLSSVFVVEKIYRRSRFLLFNKKTVKKHRRYQNKVRP